MGISVEARPSPASIQKGSHKENFCLVFTGDVMLGRLVNEIMEQKGASYALGNAARLLADADLSLINLECVISSKGRAWTNPPRVFYFRAAPQAIKSLKEAGIDYVSLANNHVLDYGYEALGETFELLSKAGIRWAGAGRNLREAKTPAILNADGLSVAVFAATDNSPEYTASQTHSGTWYFEVPPPPSFDTELAKQIRELRRKGIDLVIFSIHWGPNMVESPPLEFQNFAHRLVDSDVDIVHGHSAHVFQGIEIYHKKIIFYDTGDFVDDYWVSQAIDEQFLYRVCTQGKALKEIELIPVKISHFQVNIADRQTSLRAIHRMQERSEPFGTVIIENQGRWVIEIRKDLD